MFDHIEKIGNSVIQHGKYNDRIYLMKLARDEFPEILDELENKADSANYSKIFAKIPRYAKDEFLENGYRKEAFIPKFYRGERDAYFVSKYLSEQRSETKNRETIKKILDVAESKAGDEPDVNLDDSFRYRICRKTDTGEMAEVYRKVFETYPFPIHDPAYLAGTMDENIVYFGIWHNNKIVALSSSEMDVKSGNVEMTDFATLPDYRGNGFAVYLLEKMEKEMRKQGIKTAYTIARALSFGMNITFAKMGYTFSGTLINNTNISGKLESMNVWYKFL